MYRALCQAQCLVSQWLLCPVYVWCLLHPLCDLTESHKGLLLETGLASSQEPPSPCLAPHRTLTKGLPAATSCSQPRVSRTDGV